MSMDSMFNIYVELTNWKSCIKFFNENRYTFGMDYYTTSSPDGEMIVKFCDRYQYSRFREFYDGLTSSH